jgi:hypothetical protein
MAAIDLVKLTDTFNKFMDLVNSIINKVNKIEVDSSTVKLSFSSSEPAAADIATSQAILFLDSTGVLKFKRRLADGTTIQTKIVSTDHSNATDDHTHS